MRQISKEFIRDVQRVIGYDYIVGLIGLATQTVAGLMSAADKVKVDNLDVTYAPIVHTHDDRYYTEAESDATFAPIVHTHDDRYYTETEIDTTLTNYYTETETDTLLSAKLDSASYTAADVLAKVLTVDGSGSGLDADLLDGNSSAYYLPASSYTAADVLSKVLTVDGSGSGLDADLLDGQSSSYYAVDSTVVKYNTAQSLSQTEKGQVAANIGQAWEQVGDPITSNNVASIEWTGLSIYNRLRITGQIKVLTNTTSLGFRLSQAGVWLSGAGSYERIIHGLYGTTNVMSSDSNTKAHINGFTGIANNVPLTFELILIGVNDVNVRTTAFSRTRYYGANSTWVATSGTHGYTAALVNDGVQILADSGNIDAVNVVLEGSRW